MSYDEIKRLAKERNVNIPDLLVLAKMNDPFFAGSEADYVQARWFAGLWERFGFDAMPEVHLRRVHCVLVSQPESERQKWNGIAISKRG